MRGVIRNYQHFFWNRLRGLNFVRKPIHRDTVAIRVLYWSNNCYWYTCHRRILKGDFWEHCKVARQANLGICGKNVGFIETKMNAIIFCLIYRGGFRLFLINPYIMDGYILKNPDIFKGLRCMLRAAFLKDS